jgi:sec-independent protein translocase protein TatB
MFDLGWTELLVIGIVALIVVGPKDLPGMFRTVGNFVGKAKRMAREFSKAMNDAADDAGVGDVKRSLDAAANPMKTAMGEVKKSTESFTAHTMAGPKRAEMTPERAEAAEKIRKKSAEMAEERLAAEAAEKAAPKPAASASAKKPAAKPKSTSKTAAKKPAAKSSAAKKPAAKAKAAPKKAAAKTTSGKKAAENKA